MRGGAAARSMCRPPRDRGRVVSAAAPAAGSGLSPGAVSRAGSRGLSTPEVCRLDAEPRLDHVVAMAKTPCCSCHAEPDLLVAQAQSAASGQTAHVYADTRYRARRGTATAAS